MVSVLELRIYNRFLAEFICNDIAVNVVDFLDKKTMDFSSHVRSVRSDHWVAILSSSWRKYRTSTPSHKPYLIVRTGSLSVALVN
jgi:hypothetical protein